MVRERVGDWRLAWRFALAGLLAGLFVVALSMSGVINGPFFAAQDHLFPAPAPDPSVTFVAIDSNSQDAIGTYPFNNLYHAKVINYLASLHPKVILFDIVLSQLTGLDAETKVDTDLPLANAIKAAGNVVLVCTADARPRSEFATVAAAVGERGLATPDDANAVRGVVLRPDPTATCPENESDEPAFLQALRISQGITDALQANSNAGQATFGSHRIPLVGNQMLINFTRADGPSCSYQDAYNASCPHPEQITDHIVVVGAKLIDAGDIYSQAVSFPHNSSFCPGSRPRCMLENQNYGFRIQGDAMTTILLDRYVRVQPGSGILPAIVLLALLVAAAVYVLKFRVAVIVAGAVLITYYAGIVLMGKSGYLADPLYAPIAIVLSVAFSMAARYILEDRERRKVERIFGHYVDPRIVRQLAATHSVGEMISKGERRDLSLLFVDIRGFTAMSEAMAAEDVLLVIQHYLDDMSSLILKWDGTIDKYVGDEVVALWNAPVAQPDHALLALRCAYDLIAQAPNLLAKLVEHGLPPVSWGIGVNTGPAVVGNMGSKDRLQYTALGDTVNTAARYCSAAPAFNLLIGWPAYEACSDYLAVDEMPGLQLKGKSAEKFRVLKVTAIRENRDSPWVQLPTDAALESYEAHKHRYARQSVFASAQQGEP
ncbi:MAG: adenylate/guanylate cyclase domain-containing protein [Candidatus Dormibacteraeota bacterium]|nr:adenylate/guanylate cyclase domain-containing protein [Candidatus Dormibacteraeota bacterium]